MVDMVEYITRRKRLAFQQILKVVLVFVTTAFVWSHLTVLGLASSVSESFPANTEFVKGLLVSIKNTIPTTVELANVNNKDFLAGVVVAKEDSLIAIAKDGENIYVASQGEVQAFVSDINGAVRAGDFIGVSWISGVGMRANTDTDQKLLGIALEDLNPDSAKLVTDISTPYGSRGAHIGLIRVRLFDKEAGPNPSQGDSFIELLASRIAGKQVPYSRILAAAGLFSVSVIISGVFLANAIRGSFISLGRNPLASSPIFTSLLQVSGVSIALILIGAFIAYVTLVI